MTRITCLVLVCLGLASLTAPLFAEESSLDLEAKLKAVRTETGQAYLEAREQLLSLPPEVVEPNLRTMKQQAVDPLEDLLWDALIIRLKDTQEDDTVRVFRIEGPPPIERTVRLKVDFAIDEAIRRAKMGRLAAPRYIYRQKTPPDPDPSGGAGVLMRYLGDDALPIAAELVYKGLTDDWEPWKRRMLVLVFHFYGWSFTDPERATAMKDPRAGWALLWMAEHEPDEGPPPGEAPTHLNMSSTGDPLSMSERDQQRFAEKYGQEWPDHVENVASMAAHYISSDFPDPLLLQAARDARDRASDPGRRMILSGAVGDIERGLEAYGRMRARLEREAVSQPASQPADSASSQPAD